jgi:hypothetical protein
MGGGASSSTGISAPQRQLATVRGTLRPHEGQIQLKLAWPALSSVEGSGMSHNKGLNRR